MTAWLFPKSESFAEVIGKKVNKWMMILTVFILLDLAEELIELVKFLFQIPFGIFEIIQSLL